MMNQIYLFPFFFSNRFAKTGKRKTEMQTLLLTKLRHKLPSIKTPRKAHGKMKLVLLKNTNFRQTAEHLFT